MSNVVELDWQGPELIAAVESTLSDRLAQAAERVAEQTRRLLDVPQTSRRTHSRPGDSPERVTGALEQSIFVEAPKALSQQVGTDLDYGLWLERGTARIAPRPFLTRALDESREQITELLTARMD